MFYLSFSKLLPEIQQTINIQEIPEYAWFVGFSGKSLAVLAA